MKLEQAARQALEALECWDKAGYVPFIFARERAIIALREALAEQAEQEQVCIDWDTKTDEPIMGYAAPVRTKDLTDDEIETIFEYWYSQPETEVWSTVDLARAVIAAYKEKNK